MMSLASLRNVLALSGALLMLVVTPAHAQETIEGDLSRASLDKLIAAGPHALIASVDVKPAKDKGRFIGFLLTGARPNSPLASSQTIRVGDIFVAVNGQSVERPDQFMSAWEALGAKDTLTVTVVRQGKRIRYVWKIRG